MSHSELPSEIENIAALWVIKTTQRELTVEEEHEFQTWVTASDSHQETYYRARQLWSLTALAPASKGQFLAQETALVKKKTTHFRWLALACSIIFCLFSMITWQVYNHQPIDYHAKAGDILHIVLPDGSQVDLDSGAQLTLAFNPQYRQVNLYMGRAYFKVAPVAQGERRPFRVSARDGFVQALGTEFMVNDNGKNVDVSVYQHSVKITLLSGAEAVIDAGSTTHYQQKIWPVVSLNQDNLLAWREGQIIFHQRTLSDVISEISRYRDKPIVLIAKQSNEKVSGVFQIKSIERALAHLTSTHHLSIYEMPFFTLVY